MHVGWVVVGVIVLAIVGLGYAVGARSLEPIAPRQTARRHRPRLRLAIVGVATVLLVVTVYSIVKPVKVFGIQRYAIAGSLRSQVEREVKDPVGYVKCRGDDKAWDCEIEGDPGSGGPIWTYTLASDDAGCWNATPGPREPGSILPLAACLDFGDYLTLD